MNTLSTSNSTTLRVQPTILARGLPLSHQQQCQKRNYDLNYLKVDGLAAGRDSSGGQQGRPTNIVGGGGSSSSTTRRKSKLVQRKTLPEYEGNYSPPQITTSNHNSQRDMKQGTESRAFHNTHVISKHVPSTNHNDVQKDSIQKLCQFHPSPGDSVLKIRKIDPDYDETLDLWNDWIPFRSIPIPDALKIYSSSLSVNVNEFGAIEIVSIPSCQSIFDKGLYSNKLQNKLQCVQNKLVSSAKSLLYRRSSGDHDAKSQSYYFQNNNNSVVENSSKSHRRSTSDSTTTVPGCEVSTSDNLATHDVTSNLLRWPLELRLYSFNAKYPWYIKISSISGDASNFSWSKYVQYCAEKLKCNDVCDVKVENQNGKSLLCQPKWFFGHPFPVASDGRIIRLSTLGRCISNVVNTGFQLNRILELNDGDRADTFRIAEVVQIIGYRLCLRYTKTPVSLQNELINSPQISTKDARNVVEVWKNMDSEDIYPIGFVDSTHRFSKALRIESEFSDLEGVSKSAFVWKSISSDNCNLKVRNSVFVGKKSL